MTRKRRRWSQRVDDIFFRNDGVLISGFELDAYLQRHDITRIPDTDEALDAVYAERNLFDLETIRTV